MRAALIWTGNLLQPFAQQDFEVLRNAYAHGEIVEVDVVKTRNVLHHRKFFALFREQVSHGCVLHSHRFENVDALRAYVEICIGWCDYYDIGPVRMPVPRTIRFDSVDQIKFSAIYNNAVLFMADEIEDPCPDIVAEADDLIAKGIERTNLRDKQ